MKPTADHRALFFCA